MWDVVVRATVALLTMGLPFALFFFLRARVHAPSTWRLFRIGGLTFIASQVVHIPLNAFLLLPLLGALGLSTKSTGSALWLFAVAVALSAGVCEEVARYIMYRCWLTRRDRQYKFAATLGGGHGGCEALLVGLALFVALIVMSYLRHQDLDKILPPEKVPEVRKALEDYWSAPVYKIMMAPVERITAMTFHVSASVLVLQVFTGHSFAWLGAAIGFHTLIDTVAAVAVIEEWNAVVTEAVLALVTLPLATWILVGLWDTSTDVPGADEQDRDEEATGLLREHSDSTVDDAAVSADDNDPMSKVADGEVGRGEQS